MGLKVPLDDHMPVTAYGTMYWFRIDALKKIFEWRWRDYNPEPNHIDGGLAHVQERLLETMVGQGWMRLYRRLQNSYGAMLRHVPGSRRFLRPLARHGQSLISPGKIR